jgi:hypothetical protein
MIYPYALRINACCLSLLSVACAGVEQKTIERNLRNEAVAGTVYKVPESAVWDGILAVLAERGYQWLGDEPREGVLGTDWKCGSDSCRALKVIVLPLNGNRRRVLVLRTTYDDTLGDNVVPVTQRALDVEWALLRRLEPTLASSIKASATAGAVEALKAGADLWNP